MDKLRTTSLELSAASYLDEYITGIINNQYENNAILNPLTNLLIRFTISKFLILTMKEDIITKPKNSTYNNTLLFSDIDAIAATVSDKQPDGTYDLGGRIFTDPNSVIAFVRNKLAHGDYQLSDDYHYLIFAPGGEEACVDIMRIEYLGETIAKVFGEYRSLKNYTRGLVLMGNNKPINKIFQFVTDEDIYDILDGIRVLKFDIESNENCISKTDFIMFDSIIQTIKTTTTKTNIDNVVNDYQELVKEINENGSINSKIDMSYSELSIDEKEYIKLVFRKIKGDKVLYADAISELGNLSLRTSISKYNSFYANLEVFKLLRVIEEAFNMQTSDIRKIADKISVVNKDVTFSGIINVSYDYAAISQIIKLMALSNLFEISDSVRYDIFELLGMEPKLFVIKDNKEDELLQLEESASKRIAENKASITRIKVQINNIECSNMEQEKKDRIIKDLYETIKDIESTKKSNVKDVQKHRKDLEHLQKDKKENPKYYYNKYLLEYIRNSICHGNVDIIPAGSIDETIIRFRDYYKEEPVFEFDITVGQLKVLFSCNSLKLQLYGIVNSVNKKHL